MNKVARRRRPRLQAYVDPAMAARVKAFCAASAVTESAAVEAALRQYLDRTADATLLLRRFDWLERAAARAQRDVEIFTEAFATFVKLWFAHTPTIPEDATKAARATGQSRYKKFVEHLSAQLSQGARFVDDLPHEKVADDSELATAAATATAPPSSSPPAARTSPPPAPKRRGAP